MLEANPLHVLDAALAQLESRYSPKKLANGLSLGRSADKPLMIRIAALRGSLAKLTNPNQGAIERLEVNLWGADEDSPVDLQRDEVIISGLTGADAAIATVDPDALGEFLGQLEGLTQGYRKPAGLSPVLTQVERWVNTLEASAPARLIIYEFWRDADQPGLTVRVPGLSSDEGLRLLELTGLTVLK